MFDKVVKLSNSIIQHGPYNDRIYLMKMGENEDVGKLIDQMLDLAIVNEYSKIFVNVPDRLNDQFIAESFKLEASVPDMYNGKEDGSFLGLYLNAKRGYLPPTEKDEISEVINNAKSTPQLFNLDLPEGFEIQKLNEDSISELAEIYRTVFQFYPFPIHREDYLAKTMRSGVRYFGIRSSGKLVAVSSAAVDDTFKNVEMTDFATLHKYRGNNLSYFLLQEMLTEMKRIKVRTAYSIARSTSYGMNKTFSRLGFNYSGTLTNNTRIGDRIESMNVWHKCLKA